MHNFWYGLSPEIGILHFIDIVAVVSICMEQQCAYLALQKTMDTMPLGLQGPGEPNNSKEIGRAEYNQQFPFQ